MSGGAIHRVGEEIGISEGDRGSGGLVAPETTPSQAESLAWRHPWLCEAWYRISPLAARLRARERDAVLGAVGHLSDPSAMVLEVGCGRGGYTFALARGCEAVIALDSSPAMLRSLDRRRRRAGVRNVETRTGRLPDRMPGLRVRGVVAAGVLDYQPALEPALCALRDCLAPDGWLVATVPLRSGLPRPAALAEGRLLRSAFTRLPEEVLGAVRNAGLSVAGSVTVRVLGRDKTLVVWARPDGPA